MLKPFYQGKLDTFCAIYAVLNAFRLTHGIRTTKARDILNDTLLALGKTPDIFSAVLNQQTDYIQLVDYVLDKQAARIPVVIEKPFAGGGIPTVDELWKRCDDWLAGQENGAKGRAIIFRFLRYMRPSDPPLNRHWTTADYVSGDVLHLFDCSHEAEAILNIRKDTVITTPDAIDQSHLMYIQPESVRFLRLPF